jgi:hypothetical protein
MMTNLVDFAPQGATFFDPELQLYCAWDNGLFYYINREWVQSDSDEPRYLILLENINE